MENYKLDGYNLATLLMHIPDYPVETNELEKLAENKTMYIDNEFQLLKIVEQLYIEMDNGKSPSSLLNKRRGQLTMFVLDVLNSKIQTMSRALRSNIAYQDVDDAHEHGKIIDNYQTIKSYAAELGECLKKMYPQEYGQRFGEGPQKPL